MATAPQQQMPDPHQQAHPAMQPMMQQQPAAGLQLAADAGNPPGTPQQLALSIPSQLIPSLYDQSFLGSLDHLLGVQIVVSSAAVTHDAQQGGFQEVSEQGREVVQFACKDHNPSAACLQLCGVGYG